MTQLNKNYIIKELASLKKYIRKSYKYPMRGYTLYSHKFGVSNLTFELYNIINFLAGGNNMFHPSLIPELYKKIDKKNHFYFDFFIKGTAYTKETMPSIFQEELKNLSLTGLIKANNEIYQTTYRVIEFEDLLFITDHYSQQEDMVWLSLDSFNTARMISKVLKNYQIKNSQISILDLCCGSGLVGCYMAKTIPNSILSALDLNSKAMELIQLNCDINNINYDQMLAASIYDYEFDKEFDIIVSNPAYGSSPYEKQRLCHDGGSLGIEQVLSVFDHIIKNLKNKGCFFVMIDTPIIDNQPALLTELKKTYIPQLNINYEALWTYQTNHTKMASDAGINSRQRAFIHGNKSLSKTGKLSYKNKYFYSFLNKF